MFNHAHLNGLTISYTRRKPCVCGPRETHLRAPHGDDDDDDDAHIIDMIASVCMCGGQIICWHHHSMFCVCVRTRVFCARQRSTARATFVFLCCVREFRTRDVLEVCVCMVFVWVYDDYVKENHLKEVVYAQGFVWFCSAIFVWAKSSINLNAQ